MPDVQRHSRPTALIRARRCATLALSVCVTACFVSPARTDETAGQSSPSAPLRPDSNSIRPPQVAIRWQKLDIALSDLDPGSAQARQLVPELIEAVRHEDAPEVLRQRSMLMLGRIGKPAAEAIPVMLSLLKEELAAGSESQAGTPSVSPAVIVPAERHVCLLKSLGLFGREANIAVPTLRRELQDQTRTIDDRVLVADVLGQIGTVASVSTLSDTLRQWPEPTSPTEQLVKRTLVDSIGFAGPAGVVGLPTLLRTIEDTDSSTRRKVCEALTQFGPASELATNALVERIVLDDDAAVRDAAADALAAIGPSSVPTLVKLLESGDPELQWRAARSLGRIGTAATQSLKTLEEVIASSDSTAPNGAGTSRIPNAYAEPDVRIEALEAHWKISHDTTGVFREVLNELGTRRRQSRRRACQLLIEPPVLPVDILSRLQDLAAGDSQAARDASYVLHARARNELAN
ncbi:hypothetical protein GC176_17155 [bacterium]|nr:hypothetical protein [bacterium]